MSEIQHSLALGARNGASIYWKWIYSICGELVGDVGLDLSVWVWLHAQGVTAQLDPATSVLNVTF